MLGTRSTLIGFCTAMAVGCHAFDPSPSTDATLASVPTDPAIALVRQLELEDEASPTAAEWTLDLDAALRLAGVDNPTILLAREQIQEALARQTAAKALLIPSANIGGNYRMHNGAYQSSAGIIRDVDTQSLYLGAGAGAVGSGTVAIPGVWLFANLGDAAYEPQAARQQVAVRQSEARAVNNAILLDVAIAYLDLVGAEARLKILDRGNADVTEIARITAAFAATGQGTAADANRATANAELVRSRRREAEGEIAAASARLCRLLNLDPSIRVRTPESAIELLRIVDENGTLESLIAAALASRPELLARSAAIDESRTRLRQERVRPLLPTVSAGFSGGGFGGNLASEGFGPLRGRMDVDVMAVWNFENLGLGNRARVRRADSMLGESMAAYELELNRVRREVAEALASSQAAAKHVEIAKASVKVAEEGYRLEADRIRQGLGLPIETLDSFQQLLDSRQELLRAILAFDEAQFRLFVAIGNSPGNGIR